MNYAHSVNLCLIPILKFAVFRCMIINNEKIKTAKTMTETKTSSVKSVEEEIVVVSIAVDSGMLGVGVGLAVD